MRTRGEGGLNMTKNTHFVRRFIENATISETRVKPEGVNSFRGAFPVPQAIPISNFRPLSLLVCILWNIVIFTYLIQANIFDYPVTAIWGL